MQSPACGYPYWRYRASVSRIARNGKFFERAVTTRIAKDSKIQGSANELWYHTCSNLYTWLNYRIIFYLLNRHCAKPDTFLPADILKLTLASKRVTLDHSPGVVFLSRPNSAKMRTDHCHCAKSGTSYVDALNR